MHNNALELILAACLGIIGMRSLLRNRRLDKRDMIIVAVTMLVIWLLLAAHLYVHSMALSAVILVLMLLTVLFVLRTVRPQNPG